MIVTTKTTTVDDDGIILQRTLDSFLLPSPVALMVLLKLDVCASMDAFFLHKKKKKQ